MTAEAPTAPTGQSIPLRAFARSFLRTYLVMANFNTRGLQNIGLVYAMEPGLEAIYGPTKELVAARKRYLKHYNTHPFWTPLLVGVFLTLEYDISRGLFPAGAFAKLKTTVVYTLSAIGDAFFGGSLLAFWGLTVSSLILAGHTGVALGLGIVLFLALQAFKLTTFVLGFRRGFKVLHLVKRLDLVNWGWRLKYVNSFLLVAFWVLAWPEPFVLWQWLALAATLGLCASVVGRLGLSRESVVGLGLIGYMGLPWLTRLLGSALGWD
jgi:hypothetical protein